MFCRHLFLMAGLLKICAGFPVSAAEIRVQNIQELRTAVAQAGPGCKILLAAGTYEGGSYFANVCGEKDRPVVIEAADPKNPPKFQGGGNGLQFSSPHYLILRNLAFSGQNGNGLNIDDSGAEDRPSGNVLLEGLLVSDIGPEGNKDGIKLSGLRDFEVLKCSVQNWGSQGSGIDMVGCHSGTIRDCLFRHSETGGASGVQCKGGSSRIKIQKNRFENAGNRAVNIGGSTGLAFFRPAFDKEKIQAEASDILVEDNIFTGSVSPVAFVGVDGAVVRRNIFYKPGRWVLRILQENTGPEFVPCRQGEFSENLVVFHSSQWAAGGVNIGGGTDPKSFSFKDNEWFCLDRPAASRPALPVPESGGVYGRDPKLRNPEAGDFHRNP